jgi:O-antigen/teichoic acid export membrane protein
MTPIRSGWRPRLGRVAGRAAWAIADQGLSSLTNFGLGMFVARELSPSSFGAFGIAFATYAFVLNIANGLISEPFHVRFTEPPVDAWRNATRQASGTAISVGLACAVLCGIVGLIVAGAVSEALLALALTLPALTLQDTWRATFFARRKGKLSFVNDLVWALTLVPALAIASRTEQNTLFWLVIAWGGAASVAAVVGSVQARCVPNPAQTFRWLQAQRDIAPRFLCEKVVHSGGHHVAVLTIGAVAGLAAVGGIRGAEMLLGPLYVVTVGIRVMAVPEAVVLLRRSARRMRQALIVLATGFSAVAIMVGLAALSIPEHWGESLLGSTWPAARPALLPIAAFMGASGASMSAGIGLRALGDARRILKVRLQTTPLVIAAGTIGGATGGSRGAAWGLALGMAVDVVRSWQELGLALVEAEEGAPPHSISTSKSERVP